MKRYLFVLLSMLTFVGCSKEKLNQKTDETNSNSTEISTTSTVDLKKEIISLEDIEKLFIDQNINLVKKDADESDFNILMKKCPTEYYLNSDQTQMLKVYVFSSQDERIKAREEYNNKTATMKMTFRDIYEFKNIMLFLIPGESKDNLKEVENIIKSAK